VKEKGSDQMKSLFKLGVILIGLIIFTYAEVWGEDWKLYYKDENFSYYYDTESIKYPSQGIVKLQMKMVSINNKGRDELIQQRKRLNLIIEGYENFTHTTSVCEINCEKKMIGLISFYEYDKKGEILFSNIYTANQVKWVPIPKGEMFELLYKVVCSK
jgi:hypothetical protein